MPLSTIVTPDADEARRWAEEELSRPEYREEGQPWYERVMEWFNELLDNAGAVASGFPLTAVLIAIAVTAVIVGVVIWIVMGPMRRSGVSASEAAFEPGDTRSAEQMRAAAHAAAQRDNWDLATMEMFRALVRGLDERGAIDLTAGTTAHEAATAVDRLPLAAGRAAGAAQLFDEARYGDGGLDKAAWEHAASLEKDLRNTRRQAVVSA
ncbi:DUF4129 domain-containing protein [Demequina sp. B12]|uniref:DUF4129 domain-containing protein n=1 Tax=Demequina sp. B12 TaxID=2992757 RepID=UPI00237B63FA|nr:DUF4129 domain-containing protein [Demequina sp. B12]MDE0573821.1 DUF4129 domain-containing protein [Demequina sp. B12]